MGLRQLWGSLNFSGLSTFRGPSLSVGLTWRTWSPSVGLTWRIRPGIRPGIQPAPPPKLTRSPLLGTSSGTSCKAISFRYVRGPAAALPRRFRVPPVGAPASGPGAGCQKGTVVPFAAGPKSSRYLLPVRRTTPTCSRYFPLPRGQEVQDIYCQCAG